MPIIPIPRSKHVCIIAKYKYPFDTRLTQQVKALRGANIHYDVICLKQDGQPNSEEIAGGAIHRILDIGFTKKNFIRYLSYTALFAIKAFAKLSMLSFKKRFKVVVVHTLPEFLLFVGWFEKLMGAKIVLDARDLTVELMASRWKQSSFTLGGLMARLIERICTGFTDHIIIASNGFKRSLVGRGINESKITVVVNSADDEVFVYDRNRTFKTITEKAQLIYHGTVSERFGIIKAIEAIHIVNKQIPGTELTILGSYDLKYAAKIKERIKDLNINDNVHILGFWPFTEIAGILKKMDIGIVPYLSDSFMNLALSTKTFEYIAAGLPVVASRLDGSTELFSEQAIQYTEPGNSQDLADKIVQLCHDPELQKQRREQAYREFGDHSMAITKKTFLEVIQKLL